MYTCISVYERDRMTGNEMSGAYSMHGREALRLQYFNKKPEGKRRFG
jgi:hypothetical protein